MRTTQGITVSCLLCIRYLLVQTQECYLRTVKVLSQVPRFLFFLAVSVLRFPIRYSTMGRGDAELIGYRAVNKGYNL